MEWIRGRAGSVAAMNCDRSLIEAVARRFGQLFPVFVLHDERARSYEFLRRRYNISATRTVRTHASDAPRVDEAIRRQIRVRNTLDQALLRRARQLIGAPAVSRGTAREI